MGTLEIGREAANFHEALDRFVAQCKVVTDAHFVTLGYGNSPPAFSVDYGPRYARIVRHDGDGQGRSVHCFVDVTNGDVLKAAGWKAPAKHARGNIFAEDGGFGALTPYGVNYLR